MPKTGKKYEWEVGVRSGDPLMATIQDYDWADEVLHAAIGREWYIPSARDAGKRPSPSATQCWSKVLSNWAGRARSRARTEHANWWPEIYLQACQVLGNRARSESPGVRCHL